MGTFRDPSTINNVGTLGGATNPTTAQALPLERENQKAIRELVGTFGYEDLTISSGGITPTKAEVTVDTEAGASADDLTTIYLVSDGTTTLHDGMILKLRAYDPARIVTVKHGTGINQIQTVSGTDIVLGTDWELTLKLQSGVWKEVRGRQDITGNAATATLATTATTANTLKQGGIIAPTSGGTSTAYTVTSSPVVTAYTSGAVYQFKAHAACGNAPTVNFDGRGAKAIKRFSGGNKTSVAAGEIPAGSLVSCLYDGTDMVIAISGDALPVGTIFDFAGSAAPAGSLVCDGSARSRTAYAALFAVIGTIYGAGDGSTTFNLPDLRGEFRRGWDDGRGVDSGRAFGSAQADELRSHTHTQGYQRIYTAGTADIGGGSYYFQESNTGATGGTETRPRNVAVLSCIKY